MPENNCAGEPQARSYVRRHSHTCRECGRPWRSNRQASVACPDCSKIFDRRRQTRGAQVYDLFMAMRYERGLAAKLGVWSLMCRMANKWREEDVRERDGRPSWVDPATVREKNLPLLATVLSNNAAGVPRHG